MLKFAASYGLEVNAHDLFMYKHLKIIIIYWELNFMVVHYVSVLLEHMFLFISVV